MKNPNTESGQAFFNMYIPEEAFISDFRMRIKNETYVAKVENKEEAKKIFEGSDGSSGLVSSKVEFKETNHVRSPGFKQLEYSALLIYSSNYLY